MGHKLATCLSSSLQIDQSTEYGTFLTFSVRTISNFPLYLHVFYCEQKAKIEDFLENTLPGPAVWIYSYVTINFRWKNKKNDSLYLANLQNMGHF